MHADQVGAVFRLAGFDEALVVTNDKFIRDAHGVPLHAFLLASPADIADPTTAGRTDADDEEVILLRVTGTAPLPQETDLQHLRARAGIELVVEDGRDQPRPRNLILDPLTEEEMQTAGLRCAVLGTFYDEDTPSGPQLAFGSDIDNVYASSRLRVYKPYGDSLQRIVSYMVDLDSAEPRRPFIVGVVRYASTRRRERIAASEGRPTDVPVHVDIADFVAHKTAVLGMTRLGKSNTAKVIATSVHQYSRENELTIGQVIFDPAGEYANVNEQDGTSLAQIGPEYVVRYRLGATAEELASEQGLRPLALNFFADDLIGVSWSLIGEFLRRQREADYVRAFASVGVEGPANPRTRDEWKEVTYARRARMMVYACLLKAGLEPPTHFAFWAPMKESLRNALVQLGGRRGEDLGFIATVPTSRRGDTIMLTASQLLVICEAIAAHSVASPRNDEIADWVDVPDERVQHIINVLLERKGSGYKILLPLREGYHSPTASDDYAPRIYADLVDGKIVIVDLSRGGEGVLQYASERIILHILERASERFRQGHEPHRIQIFLEEAHRLFNRERFTDRLAAEDPYVRLAREAGKYKLGMIYATQQVSSVDTDVLDNTANWVIAHLNSESEVKLLRGRYEFDRFGEQILHAEDPGFVRLKTRSSRFVIPIQVRRFDQAMIETARAARPGSRIQEA
jgi:DNA helicase HerA-like ATPase